MCGLAINIATFSHLLRKVDFDAAVDHLSIMQIMKSKMEPATNRIKRQLEVLSSYSFNLYYIKGKDMVLSDFLSRQPGDKSDPHQIILISFNIKEMLRTNYQKDAEATFMVKSRSQSKVKTPMVRKPLNSSNTEEHEIKPIIIDDIQTAPDPQKIDKQNEANTRIPTKYPQISQNYAQQVMRPPPKAPRSIETNPKGECRDGTKH